MLDKIVNFISKTSEDEDKKLTNAEIECAIDQEDIIAVYVEHYDLNKMDRLGRTFPVNAQSETFHNTEELRNHIMTGRGKDIGKYYFDRNNEEVRQTVTQAFKDRKCRQLKKEKEHAEKTLQRKKEELENLECEE